MIEVSATAAPALALPGAVLPAASAGPSGESTQIVDFSAVLTGSVLAIEAPATPAAQPMPIDVPTKPTVAQPVVTGKTGLAGKPSGKILPDGKLPAPHDLAAADSPADKIEPAAVETGAEIPVDLPPSRQPVDSAAPEAAVVQATSLAMASQEQRTAPLLPARDAAPATTRSRAPRQAQAVQASAAPAATTSAAMTTARSNASRQAQTAQASALPAASGLGAITQRSNGSGQAQAVTASVTPDATLPAADAPVATMVALPASPAPVHAADIVPANMLVRTPASTTPSPVIVPQAQAPAQTTTPSSIVEQTASTVAIAAVLNAPVAPASKSVRPAPPAIADRAPAAEPTIAMPQEPAARLAQAAEPRTASDLSLARTATITPVQLQVAEHKPVESSAIAAVSNDGMVQPVRSDAAAPIASELRAAPAAPIVTPNAPTTPTQDIAALVDRITEARAAAAPQTVRAALVHEDFGAISLNLRAADSHIHVTLGSADPAFAPAVHAAAAASLSSAVGDPSNESARRDAQNQQQQDTAGATNAQTTQQQAANQQASRDRAAPGERSQPREQSVNHHRGKDDERGPSTPASPRRSGIYA
ncbi:hypothetical protein HNO88_001409 [Novosphingobium chloroacetimidivorans]|uniref:Flagellar hook-length control protein FliK n=1 Tax=Novosphingobium chloroacetimidivorans TaxID=1428314 RepID=A0A7W7NWF0_9SPHN|nr:hypothetical protein [Novosphingobium chloroacetimidivorans]MBB4858095.1 hypothetical protein [Novosphingobium chloroacetimidivorans]